MRLFTAIELNKETKTVLSRVINELRDKAAKGSFTPADNLHMTLIFLGEVLKNQVGSIRRAMDTATAEPFTLQFAGLGRFSGENGDLYHLRITDNPSLQSLYQALGGQLKKEGFHIENRRYTPHLTIGRQVLWKEGADPYGVYVPSLKFDVKEFSLMQSERINGRMVYTPVYVRKL